MSVAPNGTIAIVYYSRTGQGDDTVVEVATRSGPEAFEVIPVTAPFAQPKMGVGDPDSTGDYIGITAADTVIYPIWSERHEEKNRDLCQDRFCQDLFTSALAP
jgi:hypothetical protein